LASRTPADLPAFLREIVGALQGSRQPVGAASGR